MHFSKWCQCNLVSTIWKIKKGSRITERCFHYVGEKVADFRKYNTVTDTKLYRCVGWDATGKFYRRHASCACESCVKCDFFGVCTKCGLIGAWESPHVQPKVNLFEESSSDTESSDDESETESSEEMDSDDIHHVKPFDI